MELPLPLLKNVVLVGGGHAHALVLRSWAMDPVAGARLTVINPHASAPYTGMLPGYVAGHYNRDDLEIDLVKLARFAGARLVLGAADGIDLDAKTISVPGRPPIAYDICSVNVGITSEMPTLPGFVERGTPAKPLGRFALRWQAFIDRTTADQSSAPRIAVIGGGIGGSELAMAMHHRLSAARTDPVVTIIDERAVLREVGEKGRAEITKMLDQRGIIRRENVCAMAVTAAGVELEDGTTIDADFVVGAAGARPYDWIEATGLTTSNGFITIDKTLRSVSHPSVFAAGDCADMAFDPRPKAGVFAVRQAPVLTHNIAATLRGLSEPDAVTSLPKSLPVGTSNKLIEFDPQSDYLKLISLGERSAGADKYQRFASGPALWKLKDKIDRDFMDKLNDLPQMESSKVPKNSVEGLATTLDEQPPLCGGCGAKVGLDVLAGPLGALPDSERNDIVRLPGDDAALLKMGPITQVITTDQLRAFVTDPFRMAQISTLHALGDAWAMGASPQAVLVTVTLPQLGRGLQEEWLGEIMAGTTLALAGTGAEIVGGHTSMGAELSIGYTVTGITSTPISLAGATAGQKLVLTRPIGSGVLFAAEMQQRARGTDIAALLAMLERPQGDAAAALVEHGATAMTDVTGFGLAGHLYGILRESSTADSPLIAELSLSAIPVFNGARSLSEAGVRSHLYASNASGVPMTVRGSGHGDGARHELLFDPQTAGGMLAAVPASNAEAAVRAIAKLGHICSVIGSIEAGDTDIIVDD